MRMLIALAVVASLAACTQQADNGVGRPPPETGRVSPPDTATQLPTPPDTAAHPSRSDSM